MLIYVGDSLISKLHAISSIRVKSYLCFSNDIDFQVPSIFHLAVSDRLLFGFELMLKYGSGKDVLILHDYLYLYGLYNQYYSIGKVVEFIDSYFVDSDAGIGQVIAKSRYLSLQEFNKLTHGYASRWLKRLNIQLFTHVPEAAEVEHARLGNSSLALPKKYVPMPIDDRATPGIYRMGRSWRLENEILSSDILVGLFGSVTDNKLISCIARAVAQVCKDCQIANPEGSSRIHFLICGKVYDNSEFYNSKKHFDASCASEFFHYDNPSSDLQFDGILSATDIVVSCRKQDRGQLSHIIPKAFNLGKPVLSNSRSGFTVIRDDCLIDDDNFVQDLIEKLMYLMKNQHVLHQLSLHNRRLFEKEHNMPLFCSKTLPVSTAACEGRS